jgi:hypothetical protein
VTATARLQATLEKAQLPTATVFLMGQLTERRSARMATLREAWPGNHERLQRGWQRLNRLLKRQGNHAEEAGDDEEETPAPVAVQRPFWSLRRFVGRRGHRPDRDTR